MTQLSQWDDSQLILDRPGDFGKLGQIAWGPHDIASDSFRAPVTGVTSENAITPLWFFLPVVLVLFLPPHVALKYSRVALKYWSGATAVR